MKLIAALTLTLASVIGVVGCHPNWDATDYCNEARENYSPTPIITRAWQFSSDGRIFCKAAIPSHDHYHCSWVDKDNHAIVRAWSVCPDGTAGPNW